MANTKNYSIRERVLDHYLSSGQWYSRRQLEEFCNRALEEAGCTPISSRTTIQNDLTTIANKAHIVIDSKRKGRVIFYRYHDVGHSIYSTELSVEDYEQLRQAFEVLERFKGMPQFNWIDELGAHFSASFTGGNTRAIVGFEDSLYNKGMEFFTPLFQAIRQQVAIEIVYQGFRMPEPKKFQVSPYYLKQYNNRWFLLGKAKNYPELSLYGLDRIASIGNSGEAYEPTDIDFDEYFDDIIGVSLRHDEEPVTVELWFNAEQLRYVETKPLHGSQRIIQRNDTGGIVQLNVIINFELEQRILSFGEKVKVLSPESLKEKIKIRISASLQNY